MKQRPNSSTQRLCAALLVALASTAAQGVYAADTTGTSATAASTYTQHNLVGNTSGAADVTDPNLVNPWGLAFNPFGLAWVANNGTGVATVYDGAGALNSTVVQIPTPSAATGGHPTGVVFNGSSGFQVTAKGASGGSSSGNSGSSSFIFATEEGVIAGRASDVDKTHAIVAVDNSSAGAVYKGLAISANGSGSVIYATDFHNNKVDVFDSSFKPVTQASGAFTDPSLPSGFAPFGIQAINGSIYVSYAQQDSKQHDDVAGQGLGFVNVFDANGVFIKRLISQGTLNAPWGMALAPASFGDFGSRLLVGNFGDGTINAYDIATGTAVGPLVDSKGSPVKIDGLWSLMFGNGFNNQPVNTLFFTAGPNSEQGGLYGRIDVQNASTTGQTGTGGASAQSQSSATSGQSGTSSSSGTGTPSGTTFGTTSSGTPSGTTSGTSGSGTPSGSTFGTTGSGTPSGTTSGTTGTGTPTM